MRSASADLIRILATYLVVVIHVGCDGFYEYHPLWFINNFYGALASVCVPLFFMLSGALLLPKEESIGEVYRKRVLRLAMALVAWSYLYLTQMHWMAGKQPESYGLLYVFQVPASGHLWFLFAIIGLYAGLPVLRVIAKAERGLIGYLILLWFLSSAFLPEYTLLAGTPLIHEDFASSPVTRFAGYFFLGHWLLAYRGRREMWMGLLLYLCGCYATYALSRDWTLAHELHPRDSFYAHHAPSVILAASGMFVFLQNLGEWLPDRPYPWLREIGRCCFGIFLAHPFALIWLKQGGLGMPLLWNSFHPFFAIPLVSLLIFCITLAGIWAMRRVPIAKTFV